MQIRAVRSTTAWSRRSPLLVLSIVIVNWNTRDMLKDCLFSIRQTADPTLVKVIVVDNASEDGSWEMVKEHYPEVALINSGGNIGFGRANNLGVANADTPLVLFLNPDTIVKEKAIARMIEFMQEHPDVGALGSKMMFPDGRIHGLGLQRFPSPLTELFNLLFVSGDTIGRLKKILPYKDPNTSGYVSKLYGGCLLVRREILEKVGGFDERYFMYGEDVDLCKRILDGGWKLYYLSEAEIIHLVAGASGNSSNQFSTLMKCESIFKLMKKHYGQSGAVLYRTIIFTGSLTRLLLLVILLTISSFSPLGMNFPYEKSFQKYTTMIKWSLNLKKPIIKN